jgi:hypothetical protein
MHCGFESLGTLIHFEGNLCDDKGSCDHDSCDLLEGGGYASFVDVIDVAPVLLASALILQLCRRRCCWRATSPIDRRLILPCDLRPDGSLIAGPRFCRERHRFASPDFPTGHPVGCR